MTLNSSFGVGHNWPLTYADLEPHNTTCEELIGLPDLKPKVPGGGPGNFPCLRIP
jgi:hypothetical protein